MGESDYAELRRRMVDGQLPRGLVSERVREVMGRVPRHRFVPPHLRFQAYEDWPLPIGHGQTISQPLMVALMLEAAELRREDRVLEVGTGSGYQAALLAELVAEVFTIEIVEALASAAREALEDLGTPHVTVLTGDGSVGYPPAAPFQAILVAAGAPAVPSPLVDQLADGGRLLIPVGPGDMQILRRLRRHGARVEVEDLDACAFVPLVGALGVDHSRRGRSR